MKIAYTKVENICNMFYLLGDVPVKLENQQNIIERDMLSCNYVIELDTMKIQEQNSLKAKNSLEKEKKRLSKQQQKVKNEAKQALITSELSSVTSNFEFVEKSCKKTQDSIKDFEKGGIEQYAKKVGKESVLAYVPVKNVED